MAAATNKKGLNLVNHIVPETPFLLRGDPRHLRQVLINTSRGSLIDTTALIAALKSRHLGAVGLGVYEEEAELYFKDHYDDIICDDSFERLL